MFRLTLVCKLVIFLIILMEKMQRILRLFSYIKLKCNPTNVASSRVEMAKKNSCKFNHAEKRTLPEERGPHYQRKQSTDGSYFYLSLGSMFNNIFQILFFIRKIGHSLDTISSIAHRKIKNNNNVFTFFLLKNVLTEVITTRFICAMHLTSLKVDWTIIQM